MRQAFFYFSCKLIVTTIIINWNYAGFDFTCPSILQVSPHLRLSCISFHPGFTSVTAVTHYLVLFIFTFAVSSSLQPLLLLHQLLQCLSSFFFRNLHFLFLFHYYVYFLLHYLAFHLLLVLISISSSCITTAFLTHSTF